MAAGPGLRATVTRLATVLAVLVCYVSASQATIIDWSQISTPPRFVHRENDPVIYFKVETVGEDPSTPVNLLQQTIYCIAEGNPKPDYQWKKNGKPFNVKMYSEKIVQKPGEGTLVFSKLEESDEGIYQCEAYNSNGTAVSRPTKLQHTWMRSFPPAEPEVVQVELGEAYSRNCTAVGSQPNARVFWILKGEEQGQFDTINGSHISSNEQGTLFFHHVRDDDFKADRLYTCTAENTELKEYKFGPQFKLEITKNRRRSLQTLPPTEQYVNQSSPVALQGNQHKLHCFFSGYPAPRPTWYHNGREINDDTEAGFKFEAYGKTLVFNVTMDKAGKYDCRFPMHNDIDRTFNVVVEAAPYWPEGPPPNTNTSEGETVTFDCTTSGKPVPVVTFYKNGVEMRKAVDGEKWLIDGNKLTIYDVRKGIHGKGDNAVYQCKAENKHGYVWTNFYLNLLAFKPQLLGDPGEVEAVSGQGVTLECTFFGSPNAAITWTSPKLQGVPHDVVPANGHGVGKLIIKSVTQAAEGEYECIGTNKYGEARGKTRLSVRKPTRLEPFPQTEDFRIAGDTFTLPCEANADDKLEVKYQWFVNGAPLPEARIRDGHYVINADNSLTINKPNSYDNAKVKCVASTKLDKVEKEIDIKIKDVPPPVIAGYVSKCEAAAQSAEITFEHMEPESTIIPVKEFWIQYQMDSATDSDMWTTHPVPVQATGDFIVDGQRKIRQTATVGLQPYGKYTFRVIARNSVGDSSPTKVRDICVTPSKRPDRNPIEVTAKGSGPENIIVHWKPMPREEWNGENFHYKIRYRVAGQNVPFKELNHRDPFSDRLTINFDDDQDVKPFQLFEIQVVSVNDEGTSSVEPQTIEGRTGEGIPTSIPEDFKLVSKDGTTATFAWSGVDPWTANGNFTGYKITYWADPSEDEDEEEEGEDMMMFRWKRAARVRRDDSDGQKPKYAVFGPAVTQGTITDLKPGTTNYAVIQVINGINEGERSQPIVFRTDEGVPSPVRRIKAFPMNNKNSEEKGVVSLMWKKPRQKNGKIQKYIVEACRMIDGVMQERDCIVTEVDPTKTQTRIEGLEHETPYRFVIKAATGVGEGDPNSEDATTLPEYTLTNVDPGTPTFVENDIGNDYFNVTFRPSAYDEAARAPVGNTFLVQYKEDGAGDDEWKTVKQQDEDLTVTVADLSPGTRYDVRVAAIQSDPTGDERQTYSPISHITTTGRSPRAATLWALALLLLILLLLLLICCICCVLCRQRGQNYPVSEKEREQGREPILKGHFGEYRNDDDKRSLTSQSRSETDSMAEYGDTDPGRFTEDGSFIGQYVPQNKLLPVERPEKGSTSTFV